MSEQQLPEIVRDDPRIGRQAIDLTEGHLGVIEQIIRFPDGYELFQLGYGSGWSCGGLDWSQIQVIG
jgi:hypothetical protein